MRRCGRTFSEILGNFPKFPNFPKFSQFFPNRSQSRFFYLGGRSRITLQASEICFETCQETFQRSVTSKFLSFAAKCQFRNIPIFLKFSEIFGKVPKNPKLQKLSPDLLSRPLHVLALRLVAGTSRTMFSVGNGLQRQRRTLTGRLQRTCYDFFYHRV
jgi:hypothetical protein